MAGDTTTLGERIRQLRRQGAISLKQMAEATHISIGFLSLLENGKHDVSIGRLQRISDFLSVDIRVLMPDLALPQVIHIPANASRARRSLAGDSVEVQILTHDVTTSMTPLVVTLRPGATLGAPSSHHGQEFIMLLEGEVVARIGAEEFTLRTGDSLYYEAMLPHSFRNATRDAARLVSVSNSRGAEASGETITTERTSMIQTTKILERELKPRRTVARRERQATTGRPQKNR